MRASALGEAVTHLPWLCPGAAALAALARAPAAAWEVVRGDPGALLLVVREARAAQSLPVFFPTFLHDPAVLEGAVRVLSTQYSVLGTAFVDWTQPPGRRIYQAARVYAELARRVAERSGRCDPENAWTAGMLAPLGWLAVCAIDPARAAACLDDPAHAADPAATQRRHWGLDQAAFARRLARRWQLPGWLAAVVGRLGLPVEPAQAFGADPGLFQAVQLAVGLAQLQIADCRLQIGPLNLQSAICNLQSLGEVAAALGLPAGVVAALEEEAAVLQRQPPPVPACEAPQRLPLLPDLLALAAENRRLRGEPALRQLEASVDELHRLLEMRQTGEGEELRVQKLRALAEFAAGAGHEINNPLAVISGQAQYLLGQLAACAEEPDDEPAPPDDPSVAVPLPLDPLRRALHTIIRQSQRIHQTLRDLMQFARPPRPKRQPLDLAALVAAVAADLTEFAAQRRVRLCCDTGTRGHGDTATEEGAVPASPCPRVSVSVYADPAQTRTALSCLLRNAIEAAPADGWAGVRLEAAAPDRVDVVVEDSGAGLNGTQQEHLFDPFYSGRPAGRGRGLGLPVAWRLARENGGDVRLVNPGPGPTRFVLTLPRAKDECRNSNDERIAKHETPMPKSA